MGERQPVAPFDLPSEELLPGGDAWRSHLPKTDRLMWAMRAAGLLVLAATVGWTLLGGHLVPPEEQTALEVVAILVAAAAAILIAAYTQRRNVDMERAYSSHLESLSRHLRYLAYRDFLTGLYNHRYFQEQLASEVERAQRYGHHLSVLMLDVDRFKQVNDTYGHLMGDTLLSYVARLISAKVRSSDVAARYGGDEFGVILPETDQEKAIAVAEKLRRSVSGDRHWQGALLGNLGAGICFGVASFPDDGRTADDLLVCADRRLYSAKGRRPRPVRHRKKLISPLSGLQAG
jgi:diguanylate cyclase (GGDEF)-like protein